MKGVRGNTAHELCASRFPLGLGNTSTAGIKSKSLDHRELSRCKRDTKLKNCAPREANVLQLCLEWVGHAFPVPGLFIRQQLPGRDFLQVYIKEHVMSLDP